MTLILTKVIYFNTRKGIVLLKYLQQVGKALLLPVAVLPAAAILMGIGYWIDPTGWGANSAVASFLISAGSSILDHIPMIFAVGLAFGMTKDNNGSAAIAGLVGFLTVTTVLSPASVANLWGRELSAGETAAFERIDNAFIGIIVGLIAAALYNHFHKIELPDFLAFFSGRRMVPILTSAAMLLFALVLLFVWPIIFNGLVGFGEGISSLGPLGAGIYGFFNRLLIPVGLHHALNSVFWFDLVGINDLNNFWGGTGEIGTTGMYMAGFFPIMMFGLPGACLAMYHTAKTKHRKRVYGLFLAASFAAFFTGVTEPIEFSFMFAAPLLYVIHALLTGLSMFIAASMEWLAGFGFSAGLIDLILSMRVQYATQWYMLIIQGIVFFALYYFIFRFAILKFRLRTPGREEDDNEEEQNIVLKKTNWDEMATALMPALGGKENIVEIDNCATRIRLKVKDSTLVQQAEIKKAGAAGVMILSKESVQVVIGPKVQFATDALKAMLNTPVE